MSIVQLGKALLLWLLLAPVAVFSLSTSSPKKVTRIEACQNKNCCRNFKHAGADMPQILADLTSNSAIEIEATGCLSRCDKGPNLRISVSDNGQEEQYYLQGVNDHIRVATELDALGVQVPSKFLAACSVLEKAHLATSPSEKDRFLSSVIRALEGLNESSVLARALVLRADLHLEASRYTEALQDAQRALTMPASKAIAFRAHRLCADAHEAQGRYPEAIECLLKLGANDSSFQTKINKEIQRLQSAIRR